MQIRAKHNLQPVNPLYPNAWRGETGVYAVVGNTGLRLRWFYAHRENDYLRVDPYKRINVAPSWAKWFSFVSYYAGMSRNMYHLTIGHVNFSLIPTKEVWTIM